MSYFGKSYGGGRRTAGRSPIAEQAVVTTRSCCCSAAVLDISRTGAKIRSVRDIAVGDELLLKIDNQHLFGTIRWVRNKVCGFEFETPISRFQLEQLRKNEWAGYRLRGVAEQRLAMEDWNTSLVR